MIYSDIKRYLEIQFVLSIYQMILKSGVCPETNSEDWLKTVCYLHDKGWLHYGKENGQVVTTIGAYRIKEFDETKIDILPEKEEGNILYVAFNVSTAKDNLILKRMLTQYVKDNPDIEEIIFYIRNSAEKFKRIKLQGVKDVKNKSTNASSDSDISREPAISR